jgi:DNA invertase Pin-like site-specific DNA recombinase
MKRPINADPAVAIAYIRVSTEDQSLGAEAQRARIAAWATSSGVQVAAWFTDKGVSGGKPVEDRPALLAALQALRIHGAGRLVAAKRDRIARDVVVAATVERLAQDAGARVVTADGVSTEDTPEGMLMRTLMDAFASYERAVIRSRTRAALAVKRGRGERLGGDAPIGYMAEGPRLVPSEAEQAILGRVRDMRGRGLSIARVAAVLNAEGVTIRGGRIHPTTLARALRRPVAA